MKMLTQLVILALSLLLVKAHDDLNHYSTNPSSALIHSCCDLRIFPPDRVPTGVYKMSMGTFAAANVYCDMTTGGGGWIVIQRNRKNSQTSFNKNWREYEEGFGDLNEDFWAGLELMHTLIQKGQWEMRLDYQKNDKTWANLHTNQFSIGNASDEYSLTVGGYTGVGTVWLDYHNGMRFSTPGNDNDKAIDNCAAYSNSGWWYNGCTHIDINRQPPYVNGFVLFSEIKIRPRDCITQ